MAAKRSEKWVAASQTDNERGGEGWWRGWQREVARSAEAHVHVHYPMSLTFGSAKIGSGRQHLCMLLKQPVARIIPLLGILAHLPTLLS
jgi:hypothetical protein